MSGFSREESRVKARALLIQRIKETVAAPPPDLQLERRSSSSSAGDESWEQSAKRRRIEKQDEVARIA